MRPIKELIDIIDGLAKNDVIADPGSLASMIDEPFWRVLLAFRIFEECYLHGGPFLEKTAFVEPDETTLIEYQPCELCEAKTPHWDLRRDGVMDKTRCLDCGHEEVKQSQ